MRTLAKQHPLVVYVVLTYIFSWSIFIPLALKKHGIIELPIPFPVYSDGCSDGEFNFTTASKASKAGIVAAIISTIVMIWAVLVVVLYKPANLSRSEKNVL